MEKHGVEAEELQAYLDRELAPARQAEVEVHLRECAPCAALLADLQRVSATLQHWQVEPAPASLRPPILEEKPVGRRWSWPRLALTMSGALALLLVVVAVSLPNLLRSRMSVERAQPARVGNEAPPPSSAPAEESSQGAVDRLVSPPSSVRAPSARAEKKGRESTEVTQGLAMSANKAAPARRLIASYVTMVVEVKEFDTQKAKLLQVVQEAGGYVSAAQSAETPKQPRRADVTVRVPAEKLSAVLEQLRGLGRVTQERLSTDEVTDQVVDLEARLRNARATEQRLIAVLQERTGKVGDILDVEREIASTREEIERMEAQRQNLLQRVEMATVSVTLVEEFKAELQPAPVGAWTQLHNAAVAGYDSFVGSLLGLALFLARYGLTLALWGTLLRLGWLVVRRPLRRMVS